MVAYSLIIGQIANGRVNGNCDFIGVDTPDELEILEFEHYYNGVLERANKILKITSAGCKVAKEEGTPFSCDTIITLINSLLKGYPILEHIRDELKRKENDMPMPIPTKEKLRLLFAKAITCLGFIEGCF